MSDSVATTLIQAISAVLLAVIGVWNLRVSQKAKDSAKQAAAVATTAVVETVKGNETVAEVHALVNGQRDAMQARITQLETVIRLSGMAVPAPLPTPEKK